MQLLSARNILDRLRSVNEVWLGLKVTMHTWLISSKVGGSLHISWATYPATFEYGLITLDSGLEREHTGRDQVVYHQSVLIGRKPSTSMESQSDSDIQVGVIMKLVHDLSVLGSLLQRALSFNAFFLPKRTSYFSPPHSSTPRYPLSPVPIPPLKQASLGLLPAALKQPPARANSTPSSESS